MIVRGTKRARHGKRRMDLSAVREALKDRRIYTCLALVVQGQDGIHYEIDEEEGDILIEVVTVPEGISLTARLGAVAGGANTGIYAIPPVGTEVAIMIPSGDLNMGPIIVATLSTGGISNPSGQGPTDTQTVIVNGTVLIHDGSGGAQPLVTKAEFDAHLHPTGVGPSGVPNNSPITGTTVLKAQ